MTQQDYLETLELFLNNAKRGNKKGKDVSLLNIQAMRKALDNLEASTRKNID